MGRGKVDLAVTIHPYIFAFDQPVAGDDFLLFGIPCNQLVVCISACIVIVEIQRQPGTSTGSPEGHFPQPPDFLHRMRRVAVRSEEHTSELQSLMRISYAVFCLKKKK